MKTKNPVLIKLVEELAVTIDMRKTAEKAEARLKAEIKEEMGNDLILDAGNYYCVREIRNRSDLDKEAVMHDLGQGFFDKYNKRSQYEIFTVKPARAEYEATRGAK